MNTLSKQASSLELAACDETTFTHWFRNALWTTIVSMGIGLTLTLLQPSLYGLVENLVYSLCIGLSIYAAITLVGRWFVRGAETNPLAHYLVRGLVAVPLGLFVGLNVAALLRGNPAGFAVFNRAAVFALPITIVTSAATMYFLWSKKRLADTATAHAQAQRMMAETQLRLLQAQIEPHMLFNTLANLRTLVEVDPLRAQAMIDQLIVYLRGTLAASRTTRTTLEQEFAQLAAYLDLMKVRMATRLTVVFELPSDLAAHAIPPMLLQPLVENAIKHGLEPKIEGGIVRVTAAAIGDRLQIDVCDDGIGLSAPASGDSYGLEHVRERLRTLYGDAASLVVEPRAEGGVRARVVLPPMNPSSMPTALIAEDEPLLAVALRKQLREAWPDLQIVAEASDGIAATSMALDATPDILFLDIKMPGRTGLDVAEAVIDEWPDTRPAPLIVFITAYDEFALAAFERQAADYVLKPVTPERIGRTVARLRERLAERSGPPAAGDLARLLQNLQGLAAPSSAPEGRLDAIHVGVGNHVRIVPIDDVLYFEATDKYVGVHTRDDEGLIRMSMRDLVQRLDPAVFMQIHRGTIVRRSQIAMAMRDEAGKMTLKLRDSPNVLGVSRAFVHHFRAM